MEKCTNLKGLVCLEIKLIEKYIAKCDFAVTDRNTAASEFVTKYAWLVKDIFCNSICEYRNECKIKKL